MFIATRCEESKGTIRHLDIYINKRICIVSLCKIPGEIKEINTSQMISLPRAGKFGTVLNIPPLHKCFVRSWHLLLKHLELASFMPDTKSFDLLWKSSYS